jgi:PqqD family protein of HPr-rel-A system
VTAVYAVEPADTRMATVLDGYTILYHRPSRATHVLASPAPELIGALAAGPATLAEVERRLRAAHDLAAEDGLAPTLAARLEELVASGLVLRG